MHNWKALVKSALAGGLRFGAPAAVADLQRLERILEIKLPAELRSLLSAADGIQDAGGQSWILDVDGILQYNLEVRADDSAYRFMEPDDRLDQQPIDEFLVFSDSPGNGDLLAICLFPVDGVRPGEIVLWEHAYNDRTRIAPDLVSWIQLCGKNADQADLAGQQLEASRASADLVG